MLCPKLVVPPRGLALLLIPLAASYALLTAPALSAAAIATGALTGRVSFAASGEYLELARVSLEGTGRETFTDAAGAYQFTEVPVGEVRRSRRPNHAP
ncbi:MAG: hypothetical protein RL479_1898 [Verrucomicrobiota bacterium]